MEKESLASTWSMEQFTDYVIGKDIILETDRKPLVYLLDAKDIDQLPARIQRMRMRLMRYSYTVVHVPGKHLYTADTLSRAPVSASENQFQHEIEAYVHQVREGVPITDARLEQIKMQQQEDEVCRQLMVYVEEGWPEKPHVKGLISQYHPYRGELNVVDGLLLMGVRVVIPSSLKLEVLDRLHEGHQGITKCKALARHSVWWPGLSRHIEELVARCRKCATEEKNRPEPLLPTQLPQRPWQYLATDLFELDKKQYLLLVDYYSRWIEVEQVHTMTSREIISHMKKIFARFGIPDKMRSDNAKYYMSDEFKLFSMDYGFKHVTSSPGHSSGNGEAERAVQTIKRLISGKEDPCIALLNYRATPLANGYSPAELLMSKKLKTKIPISPEQLKPKLVDSAKVQVYEENSKNNQKINFDRRHAAKSLEQLKGGDEVYMPDRSQPGVVVGQHTERSYRVETPSGVYRRNRVQLNKLPTASNNTSPPSPLSKAPNPSTSKLVSSPTPAKTPPVKASPGAIITRSGRISRPPSNLQGYKVG